MEQHFDLSFILLYTFWIFFIGLLFYLQRETRREGFPLVMNTGHRDRIGPTFMPEPKVFRLGHGHGDRYAPAMVGRDDKDIRPLAMRRVDNWPGSAHVATGNPLADGIGPAAWVERMDVPELTADGHHKIVPMRTQPEFTIYERDPNPIGMSVVGRDGLVAGTVADAWIDIGETMIRYLEVALNVTSTQTVGEDEPAAPTEMRVLVPMAMATVGYKRDRATGWEKVIKVPALTFAQFAGIPQIKNADHITLREEERITAYVGGGHFYNRNELA